MTDHPYFKFLILSQWALFSISTRNFIGSGQFSTHPLLDDRRIARSAITRFSGVFKARVHRDAELTRDDFDFFDWYIYFHEPCNYSNDANEMMQ